MHWKVQKFCHLLMFERGRTQTDQGKKICRTSGAPPRRHVPAPGGSERSWGRGPAAAGGRRSGGCSGKWWPWPQKGNFSGRKLRMAKIGRWSEGHCGIFVLLHSKGDGSGILLARLFISWIKSIRWSVHHVLRLLAVQDSGWGFRIRRYGCLLRWNHFHFICSLQEKLSLRRVMPCSGRLVSRLYVNTGFMALEWPAISHHCQAVLYDCFCGVEQSGA